MFKRFMIGLMAVAACAAVVGAGRYLILAAAYSTPEVTRQRLAEHWEAETTRTLGGTTGGHTRLIRVEEAGRRQIAAIVFKETYVGDDCVIYGSPPGCSIVCGDRPPLLIAPHCDTWEIVADRFRALDGSGVETSVADLKRHAGSTR